jgi:hypothetical protein
MFNPLNKIMMAKFKKKTEIVDAVQWTGKNLFKVYIFVYGKDQLADLISNEKWEEYQNNVKHNGFVIKTAQDDNVIVPKGDMILKDELDNYESYKADVFREDYDRIKRIDHII